MYQFDYSELLGKIKTVCGTQDNFAKAMGFGRVSLSERLNNKLDFKAREIIKACDILGITGSDIPLYFFSEKSSETRTN